MRLVARSCAVVRNTPRLARVCIGWPLIRVLLAVRRRLILGALLRIVGRLLVSRRLLRLRLFIWLARVAVGLVRTVLTVLPCGCTW